MAVRHSRPRKTGEKEKNFFFDILFVRLSWCGAVHTPLCFCEKSSSVVRHIDFFLASFLAFCSASGMSGKLSDEDRRRLLQGGGMSRKSKVVAFGVVLGVLGVSALVHGPVVSKIAK